jgi:uncharacterized integral membrane protein
MIWQCLQPTGEIYQGHFGEFTITGRDRLGVVIYRGALGLAAGAIAAIALLLFRWGTTPASLSAMAWLFGLFCLALGVSLATIHIYLVPLHRLLQACWAVGSGAALWLGLHHSTAFAIAVSKEPWNLFGVGWVFVALTGLFFKEAFCFARLEAQLLTVLLPLLLLGHWLHFLHGVAEQLLLVVNVVLFGVFAIRKCLQPIPPDIGDKSVFLHLHQAQESV